MNKKYVASIAVVIVLIAAGWFYTTNTQTTTMPAGNTAKIVNLGAVLALTGYGVNEGNQIKNGIELARTDLAKKGVTLNVDYYDDGTDPKKTITGIEIMNSKGIKTIFGPTWSFQVSAGIPVLEKYGMLALSSDESSDIIEDQSGTKNVLYGMPASSKKEIATTEWLRSQGSKKIAIMTPDNGWGQAHADAWTKAAKNVGATVVMTERISYANEGTITPTVLMKAKAEGVDTILWTGGETGITTLIKKMNELGYDASVLGTEGAHNVVRDGKAEKGSLKLYSIENEFSGEFSKKYVAMFGQEPQSYAQAAYDHAMIAADAELHKGKLSAREYILDNPYKGYAGTYDFDQKGDIASGKWSIIAVPAK
jgi:branched-chain amino acid transport system substrate-binding protein